MDLGTTIIGIVILLICALPIILTSLNSSRRKKKQLQGLLDYAEKNNCLINQHELNNNLAIGIDSTALIVFFINRTKENEFFKLIKLVEIQKCRVINSTRTVKNKDNNLNVVEKIELLFTNYDKSKKEIILEFYNHISDGLSLSGELELAEKWCKLVNGKISALTIKQ